MSRSGASLFLASLAIVATVLLTLPAITEAAIHLGDPNTAFLTQGLVGYWPLDGAVTNWTSNTTQDLSGNANTGSLVSMSTSSSPVPGKIGQAMKFNGSNDITVSDNSSLDPTSVTVSAWIKPADIPSLDTG